MAQDENRADEALTDEATQIKKRARRRLIGAAALALFAAIILPMVMDTQPAPPLKDIQVRIPSPDEGLTQNVTPSHRPAVKKPAAETSAPPPEPPRPIARPEPTTSPEPAVQPESRPAEKTAPSAAKADDEAKRAQEALSGKPAAPASWEVQLGAYQGAGSVSNLVGKLKQLGVPTYTEKVDTANGSRTRVRAGPFPSRDAAEKARARISKIIGVDGPVAQKP
jgi:DedD protein